MHVDMSTFKCLNVTLIWKLRHCGCNKCPRAAGMTLRTSILLSSPGEEGVWTSAVRGQAGSSWWVAVPLPVGVAEGLGHWLQCGSLWERPQGFQVLGHQAPEQSPSPGGRRLARVLWAPSDARCLRIRQNPAQKLPEKTVSSTQALAMRAGSPGPALPSGHTPGKGGRGAESRCTTEPQPPRSPGPPLAISSSLVRSLFTF